MDEVHVSDMSEYHVVRNGVDEQAIAKALHQRFERTVFEDYWSTQAPIWQWFGERCGLRNTFCIEARGFL